MAAEAAGTTTKSIQRWLHEPEFRRQIRELQIRINDATIAALIDAGAEAVKTLVDALHSDRETTRVAAAVHVMRLGGEAAYRMKVDAALETLDERLHSIESAEKASAA